ncbi:MAG: SGNH/GDSL hydrolase family protein, partial [Candidatus Thiodiazotropha endolucinida]|nr:SGNH/GDSL hydrolase family protein [Candidatus Thiodiazotropha taylori]MCW4260921.1 SGNH/GDSL hydrolase family protein [Candidatus Thiodiazotropha endolucinida]
NKDKHVYVTHIRGQRCVLTCNNSDMTIVASGPGNKLWRDSAFIRLSIGLYRNFTAKMDSELSLSQTSTPITNQRGTCNELQDEISPVLPALSNSQNDGLLRSIKDQIDSLYKLTLNVQKQVAKNDKACDSPAMINKSVAIQTGDNTVEQRGNEIQSENTQCSISPGTALYSQTLVRGNTNEDQTTQCEEQPLNSRSVISINNSQDRSSTTAHNNFDATNDQQKIEVIINRNQNHDTQRKSHSISSPVGQRYTPKRNGNKKSVLLIGDSVLNRINIKGLHTTVHKHSVSGATIETLLSDISLYDMAQFETVILYVGGNDLSSNKNHSVLHDQFDHLIALIKSGNPTCKIIVSKLAPRGDVDVRIINNMIEQIAFHHQCDIADNYRPFFDKHGKLIKRFFSEHDPVHPSNSGTKRLLGTMNDLVYIVNDFQKCVFQQSSAQSRATVPNYGPRQSRASVPNYGPRLISYQHQGRNGRCLNCNDPSHSTYECRHKKPIKC